MNPSLLSLISILLIFTVPATEAEQYPNEYKEKADYIYQLVKFVDWPEVKNAHSPLQFCVFGKDPFQGALDAIHLQKVKNRALHISYIKQEFEIAHCNILFVQKSAPADFIQKRYPLIIKNSILTIGENKDFSKNGGTIGLNLIKQKINVEINLQSAKDAKIKVNSNLIEIASHLHQGGQN